MMRARSSIVAAATLLAALAALFVVSAAPAAAPVITPSCSPGPSNCNAWYRSAVTVSWSVSNVSQVNCPPVTYSNDTKGTSASCTASGDGQTVTVSVNIRIDRTPPSVSAAFERGPDGNGWYTHPVNIGFSGSDATSGIASCTSGTYGGPDTAGATISGSCTDAAGNSAGGSAVVRYDSTPPVVTGAKASRRPDWGHWYRKPVWYTFSGKDATSGIGGCDSFRFRGPDGERATMKATCRDQAGNAATKSFALSYDSTPPTLLFPRFRIRDGIASLRWVTGNGAQLVVVRRTSGAKGSRPSVVYRGTGSSLRQRGLRTGVRYRYLVTAYDQAGNTVRAERRVRAESSLRPTAGSRAKLPLQLSWAPSAGASYYNVQLYRNGQKLLTRWPSRTWLRVASLAPGTYRWYVWPGLGARARNSYGPLLGSSTFVVR